MKCLKCNAEWTLGNIHPVWDSCPVCETNFKEEGRFIKFEKPEELLLYLITIKGTDILENEQMIRGYISDIFPQNVSLKESLKTLIDQGVLAALKSALDGNNAIIGDFIKSLTDFEGDRTQLEKSMNFITGITRENGTDFENGDYYYNLISQLSSDSYKKQAYAKAALFLNQTSKQTKEAIARQYEKGLYLEKDIDESIRITSLLSSEGDPEDQYQLARRYLIRNMAVDRAVVFELLKTAAEKGHVRANYFFYRLNFEAGNNDPSLKSYLKAASDGGYNPAMYEYAIIQLNDAKDKTAIAQAIDLLKMCAASDYEPALSKLRFLYMTGTLVDQDVQEAELYVR